MEKIKYYSNNDMTINYNFYKSMELVKNLAKKSYTINEILEFYNVIKIYNPEYLQNKDEEIKDFCKKTSKKLNFIIGNFCKKINSDNVARYLDDVEFNYTGDFFEMLDKYKIYVRLNKEIINDILDKKITYLHFILHNKNLVLSFDEIIREKMLCYEGSAQMLLDEYEINHFNNYEHYIFPKSLTNDDKNKILINYINSNFANINYLRLIMNFKSISELDIFDKTKLLAKRIAKKQEDKFFKENKGIEVSTLVEFKENQNDAVKYEIDGENWKFSYSIDWIKQNINDNSTLLNNFIYLFEYVDEQMRWNLVSKENMMDVIEKIINTHSKRDYVTGMAFNRLNLLSDIQMQGYYTQLRKMNVRIEDLLNWFFKQYLEEQFGIKNYNILLPSSGSNYLEKCRTILPEIDSCLKQFNYLVEDGEIDPELLQISSTHLFFENVKSLLKNKYVYPYGNEYEIISYCLFSNQCMLNYNERKNKSYGSFYIRLLNEKVSKDEIVKYEQESLQKLIDFECVYINREGYITIRNKERISILYDLYINGVVSYWKINDSMQKEIDDLVEKGILKFESTLFSRLEQNYLNYYLNKAKYTNSLDLRNMYEHGTQPFGDEEIHHKNYIIFLKLFVLIIIKINDELCIINEIHNVKISD